jgi:hypothetical protein
MTEDHHLPLYSLLLPGLVPLVQPGESSFSHQLSRLPAAVWCQVSVLHCPSAPACQPVLATAQGSNSVTCLVMELISCHMWYLENGGALVMCQANDWLPAMHQITLYTYTVSNLAPTCATSSTLHATSPPQVRFVC